jgi:hypothetical protein
MPFLIVYGLIVLGTPVLVVALYIRYSKLQSRVDLAEQEASRLASNLRFEVAELKKQLESVRAIKVTDEASHPAAIPPRDVPVATPRPAVAPVAPIAASPKVPPQPSPAVPPTQAPPQTPPTPTVVLPPAPPPPLAVVLPKAPAAESPSVVPRPMKPQSVPPPVAPPISTTIPPPLPTPQPAPQPTPSAPPMATRITPPSPITHLRPPAPSPTLRERLHQVSGFEEVLGKNWLQKLGIVLVVLGVASFGIYELAALGAVGKVLLLYVTAAALLGGGIFIEKRDRYQLLGRTLIGGGWSLLFFTTYALHHVAAMRVLDSVFLDSVLLLAVCAAMAAHTLRYRSQFVTGLAFLLGYSTISLSQDTVYSLTAGVILALGLVAIVLKMEWYELEVFGILAGYLNHLYWLYRLLGPRGANGHLFPEYHASSALLFFYWATFRLSYLLRRAPDTRKEAVSTSAAILNTLLLLASMRFSSVQPQLAYIGLLVVGALELACAQLPNLKKRRQAFIVLSTMGAALILAAAPSKYSGNNLAVLWLVGMEIFLIAGIAAREVVFRRIGLCTGFLVGAHLAIIDFSPIANVRLVHEQVLREPAVLFGLAALVFYSNFLFLASKYRELFADSTEQLLLLVHANLGVFTAATAAWACFTFDWTAVAFAALMVALSAFAGRLNSPHLQSHAGFLGVLAAYRLYAFNLHLDIADSRHITLRLVTLPILAAAFYVSAKLIVWSNERWQTLLRASFGVVGTATLVALLWLEVPDLWRPVAFILFAIALAEAARALKYAALSWHTHAVCVVAAFATLAAQFFGDGMDRWHTIPEYTFGALAAVAGYYWLAWRGTEQADHHLPITRAAYTWGAATLMLWALRDLFHTPRIAPGYVLFAVVLALVARRFSYAQLAWQANAVAVCAALQTVYQNFDLSDQFWLGINLRIVTVALVAAGLYVTSRIAAPDESLRRIVAFFHSTVATALLAVLMYYEQPNGWLAPLWAAFALLLALVDRKWQSEELPWQAHILSILALARAATFNLHSTSTWHDVSVRLLSVSLVAIIFYVMTMVVRLPASGRHLGLQHLYSWAASALACTLFWYELQPLSVAVAWAAFGLILFEYGLLRKISQFRYQSYLAFLAAFSRIFFVNLTAGEPGEFWGPRMYTILPMVAIFFLVYAQLPDSESSSTHDASTRPRSWFQIAPMYVDALVACLGTASVVALLRFQYPGEWLVVAWAALVLILFAVAWSLKRSLFLYQGMALTLLTFGRGVAHNLFGSGYFNSGDWRGRYFVVGAAVALLLASLTFAFPLRRKFGARNPRTFFGRALSAIARRPEQLQFFSAIVLLTAMLALKMRAGMVTVSWGIEGFSVIAFAIAVKERSFRLSGLSLLLLCVGKIMVMDVWGLEARDRYITLIIVGAALILVSYLYSRYEETIRQFL